jgi:hypothetical protein
MVKVTAKKTAKIGKRWRYIGQTFDVTEEDLERLQGTVELTLDAAGELVEQEVEEFTPLPGDFPCRDLLFSAGYPSIESVAALEDLTSIKGIGPKSAASILEFLAHDR